MKPTQDQNDFIWLQPISREIFRSKYCLRGEKNAEALFRGVAREISQAEKPARREEWEDRFFEEIVSTRLIPAGRILANARPDSPMKNYNNCFTIDIDDSMEGIYDSLKEDALISKMGGGVGFDISRLRPKGDPLSRGGASSGVLSFLKIFDQSAKTIMTGGQRRSAHIALLDISHPEVEDFITSKQGENNNELTQFNISVKISDAFIQAVREDRDWDLTFGGRVYKTVRARDLYNLLARNAFEHNEPGIFNADTVERYNNGWWAFSMDRVNPCGELVMPPYSLCCLAAVNLSRMADHPFTEKAALNEERLIQTIRTGIRFLDNVLDRTAYPLPKIEEFSKQWRRIGLGFTGLADLFAMLRIPYGSPESMELSRRIGRILRDTSYQTSSDLAAEKGPFPAYDREKLQQASFIQTLPEELRRTISRQGLRNIQLNTVAPTGTTSLSVGQNCSSGIEPIFSLEYQRTIRTGVGDETVKERVYDYAWLLYQQGYRNKPSGPADGGEAPSEGSRTAPGDRPSYFVTARDIAPRQAIDIQAIFQKYVDHSISKTLNLAPGTTFEEYKELYLYAYESGLKGFTTFNPEGSMQGILDYGEGTKEGADQGAPHITRHTAPARPRDLPCDLHTVQSRDAPCLVLIGKLNGSLYEVFFLSNPELKEGVLPDHGTVRKMEKGRYDLITRNGSDHTIIEDITRQYASPNSSLARFISMALRHGTPLQFIVEQLSKDTSFMDFERIVSRILKKYIADGEEVISGDSTCPECGETLQFRDGCITCLACGWSRCD